MFVAQIRASHGSSVFVAARVLAELIACQITAAVCSGFGSHTDRRQVIEDRRERIHPSHGEFNLREAPWP